MTVSEKREKNRLKNEKWRKENPTAYLEAARRWKRKHRDKIRYERLLIRYGISKEQYLLLLEQQNQKCAICKNDETALHNFSKKKQHLAVDHCHKTGKVRGLLCQDCNRGIGKFHDDPTRLQNAVDYLLRTKKGPAEAGPL